MAHLGDLSLSAAVLISAAAVFAAFAAYRFESDSWLKTARTLLGVIALLFSLAMIALWTAFMRDDFAIEYVANYSETVMPVGYKIAALWAGQEGSLLLWGWMIVVLSFIAVLGIKRLDRRELAITTATLAIVCGFFAALMLFAANPFVEFSQGAPAEGRGLNPMLQDPGMVIHPPLLFMGYSGFAIPFAILVGVLVAGRRDNRWIADIRRWLLVSWLFLTAGIVIGAWWAYVELGWGGYWAWDPVENASLLPWLTATALMHSIMVQQHRGMFKIWNASLIAVTFILCIFGTYLTRSGVIDSVHAFAPSLVGKFFLIFLGVLFAGSLGLILWRIRRLKSEHELESFVSREGAFFLGNVLLTVMMLTTLIGTIWPIISSAGGSEAITVKPAFYNRVVAPMAVALVALMALGPVLAFGTSAARKIARSLRVPAMLATVVTIGASFLITTNFWALACIAITALGTATVVVSFVRSVRARRQSTGEGAVSAAVHLIDRDHRRYGGQLAHLGVMMLVIGVAASGIFSQEETFSLRHGESARMDNTDIDITLVKLEQTQEKNFEAIEAVVEIRRDGELVDVLRPQRRFYNGWQDQPNTEVAIRTSWKNDVYVSLAGWQEGGRLAAIEVRLNPGVVWIWVGGIVMGLGALFCLVPPMLPQHRTAKRTAPAEQKKAESTESVAEPVMKAGSPAEVKA